MKARSLAIAVAAAATLGWPFAGQAKLYKWIDAEGNVTYSERKPPDVEADELNVRVRSVTSEEARELLDSQAEPLEERRRARQDQESHATAVQEREERLAKNCETARENLRVLQTNARIKGKDADGRERYLDPSEVPARIEQAKANIDKFCE